MKKVVAVFVVALATASLALAGCTQPAAPAPTQAPAAPAKPTELPKAAEPTKAPAAQPTASPQPTAVPAKALDYPAKGKTITLIIPWPAGGATDANGRLIAAALEKELQVPVQAVNKPGASAQVGITEAVQAKPDGYTIVMTNLPSSITSYLLPERKAIYGRKDLMQVANQVTDPQGIAVSKNSPYKTLKDLVAAAKPKPGQVTIADTGINTGDLATLLLQQAADVKFASVHQEGDAANMTSLLGGHVEASMNTLSVHLPYLKSGDVRVLALFDKERSKFAPDVPTAEEQGYKVHFQSVRGFSVPGGTPQPIIDLLSTTVKKAMDGDDMKKKLDEMGVSQRYMDSKEYAKFWDEYEAMIKPIVLMPR